MKYYKLTSDQDETLYLESKFSLSDLAVRKELVTMGEIDPISAALAFVEEIDEIEYEENC